MKIKKNVLLKLIFIIIEICFTEKIAFAEKITVSNANYEKQEDKITLISVNGQEKSRQFALRGTIVVKGQNYPVIKMGHSLKFNNPKLTNQAHFVYLMIPDKIQKIASFSLTCPTELKLIIFSPNSKLNSISKYALSSCVPETFFLGTGCYGRNPALTMIHFPASLETIENGAFFGCCMLNQVTFPNNSHLKTIKQKAFGENYSLEQITFPASLETIEKEAFLYCNNLASIAFEPVSHLKVIDTAAFSSYAPNTFFIFHYRRIDDNFRSRLDVQNGVLTKLIIPASVRKIGRYAFANCPYLASITFEPNSQLKIIDEGAFSCNFEEFLRTASQTVSQQRINYSPKTDENTSLTQVRIPRSVKIIRKGAFYNCRQLSTVALEPIDNSMFVDKNAFKRTNVNSCELSQKFAHQGTLGDLKDKLQNKERKRDQLISQSQESIRIIEQFGDDLNNCHEQIASLNSAIKSFFVIPNFDLHRLSELSRILWKISRTDYYEQTNHDEVIADFRRLMQKCQQYGTTQKNPEIKAKFLDILQKLQTMQPEYQELSQRYSSIKSAAAKEQKKVNILNELIDKTIIELTELKENFR